MMRQTSKANPNACVPFHSLYQFHNIITQLGDGWELLSFIAKKSIDDWKTAEMSTRLVILRFNQFCREVEEAVKT